MPIIAIALLIAAVLGGGTAVAAQQSLPGDMLWGFKVHVNEGVTEALSTSDQARAEWDITAIQTRLAEAQTLQAQGKLDAQAQADITENFKEHSQDVAGIITKLEADGQPAVAADIAARFQAAAAGYLAAQGGASAQGTVQASSATTLVGSVRTTLDEATQLSADASAKASVQGSQGAGASGSGETSASTSINIGL